MAKINKRKVEKVESKGKFLSQDELIKVETIPLEVENAKLIMALEEQSLQNMVLELKYLEQKIEKQKNKVGECHSRYLNAKAKHSAIVGEIIKNHSLESEKFSYNNSTGEIIL